MIETKSKVEMSRRFTLVTLALTALVAFLVGAIVAGGVAAAGAIVTALFLPAQPAGQAQAADPGAPAGAASPATPDPVR